MQALTKIQLQHASFSECLPPLCVHFGARQIGISVSKHTILGEAWLIVHLIQMYWRWSFPKHPLTGEVFKVRLHGERQSKSLCEERLGGNLQQPTQSSQTCKACAAGIPCYAGSVRSGLCAIFACGPRAATLMLSLNHCRLNLQELTRTMTQYQAVNMHCGNTRHGTI